MTETTLLSKGWLKRNPEFDGDEHVFYLPGEEKKRYYGQNVERATEKQKELDSFEQHGIAWKLIKCNRGFGWKVMFAFKGDKFYRMYGIYDNKKYATDVFSTCLKLTNKTIFTEKYKDAPYFWHDGSVVEKLLIYKGHYGNSYYLITNYTQLVNICFRFLKKYYNKDNFYIPEKPEKPATSIEDTPEEFKKQCEDNWKSYYNDLSHYNDAIKESGRFKVINVNWKGQWTEFANEIVKLCFENFSSNNFYLEDFADSEQIPED